MEGFRKRMTRAGHALGNSESSLENSTTSVPSKARSCRFHQQLHWLSHAVESKSVCKHHPCVGYENTYRMQPENVIFSADRVEQVVREVFHHYLHDKVYDPNMFPELIKTLADLIKDRVKSQHLARYKIIITVTVIQKKNQGTQVSSNALWSQNCDKYATVTYEGSNYFAIGTVYGVYQE